MGTERPKGIRTSGLWVALAALSVAATGCDKGSDTLLPRTAPVAAASMGAEQEFARVLALALKQPEVRAMLHDAMQQSRFNEHKLVLQTFLNTRDGARLVAAMAAAGGLDEGEVRSWAARLPAMDFYVPFAEHRHSWTGGDDVVVGANMDVDQSKFTGYTPAGGRIAFDAKAGTPKQTVIFLHPAEPKGIRASTGPKTGDGRTIADAAEPDGPLFLSDNIGGTCDPLTTDIPCEETPTGGGGNPPATYNATLRDFKNYEGDGVGGVEVMVKHYVGSGSGTRIEQVIMDENIHWSWDGYVWDDITYVYTTVALAQGANTWIKVWERDAGAEGTFGGDDFWGEGLFGGFGFRHRFHASSPVEYIYNTNPCYLGNGCGTNATVDITYVH